MKQNRNTIYIFQLFLILSQLNYIYMYVTNGIELPMMMSIVCIHKPFIVRATSCLTLFNTLVNYCIVIFSSNEKRPFNNQWSLFLRQSKAEENRVVRKFYYPRLTNFKKNDYKYFVALDLPFTFLLPQEH